MVAGGALDIRRKHTDIRRIGIGPKRTTMWIDGKPCRVEGLEEWPKIGDRLPMAHRCHFRSCDLVTTVLRTFYE